jgi:hypothetical protein
MRNLIRATLLSGGLLLALAVPGLGLADGPECDGSACVTVTPSDNLPETATVQVSGTGFDSPDNEVVISQCTTVHTGPDQGPECSLEATYTATDSSGAFGPVPITVHRNLQTDEPWDCAREVSCYVRVLARFGNALVQHHLTFTKPPDTDPPDTEITRRPPPRNEFHRAHYRWTADDNDVVVGSQCKLDRKPWKRCSSPKTIKHLDEGRHKFKVRAIDAAGNRDPTPAKDRFRVVG